MEQDTQEREAQNVNWDAMEAIANDFGVDNPIKPEEKVEETKVEEKVEETKEPELEFTAEDIEGYKKPADDGSWKAVGELFGVDVAEDTPEATVAAVQAKYKADVEEARKYSLEQDLSKYKPQTVAAIKLMEMGYSEEEAFNPTGKLKDFLKLSDAELVRTNLEGMDGWDEESVGLEMEKLSERPEMLKHEAMKLKSWVNSEIQRKESERDAIVQEYTQNKDKVAIQQKEQHLAQVKEALMAPDTFLGAKINSEANSEIFQKYSRGDYGDILKDGKAIAEYLRFKAFGNKIIDEAKKGFYAKGREEVTKQLLNIPVKQGEVSQRVVEKVAINNQSNKADEALKGDFG